jgi:hypothetical protein
VYPRQDNRVWPEFKLWTMNLGIEVQNVTAEPACFSFTVPLLKYSNGECNVSVLCFYIGRNG